MKILSIFSLCFALIFSSRAFAAVEVNSLDELDQVMRKSKKAVYVDCYSKRCPPCRILAPFFENYSQKYGSLATFVKLDLGQTHEAIEKYDILGTPTLLIFDKKGKLIDKIVGLNPIRDFLQKKLRLEN